MTNAQLALESLITKEELLKRPLRNTTAIDPADPLEIDDAFNHIPLDKEGSQYHVQLHIADAGLLIGHTALISAARESGWTQYDNSSPDLTKPMLPLDVYKTTLGLDATNEDGVPAVEISFDFDMKTRRVGNRSVNKVRVYTETLSYADHNQKLETSNKNKNEKRQARIRLGVARRILSPPNKINKIRGTHKSEDIVAYHMVAANRIMAKFMSDSETPWLFRNHSSGMYMAWRDPKERQILTKIKPALYGRIPLFHDGLGIMPYCHFTSPLRRFPDLANHLNLHATLQGLDPVFSHEEMENIGREMTELYIRRNTSIQSVAT